jgi:hypothetical protein
MDTEGLLAAAESVFDGWYADQARIDWDDFIDRLEALGFDMGDSMLGPDVLAVKRHITRYRKLT